MGHVPEIPNQDSENGFPRQGSWDTEKELIMDPKLTGMFQKSQVGILKMSATLSALRTKSLYPTVETGNAGGGPWKPATLGGDHRNQP